MTVEAMKIKVMKDRGDFPVYLCITDKQRVTIASIPFTEMEATELRDKLNRVLVELYKQGEKCYCNEHYTCTLCKGEIV